jgi:hypothetical protein
MRKTRFLAAALVGAAALLAGCATEVAPNPDTGRPQLAMQNVALNPRNGGTAIEPAALQPGDILLSSSNGIGSFGIRLMTLSPVSHASVYLGEGRVAEAVTQGIQERSVDALVQEEATIVAFRHPAIRPEHVARMREFAGEQNGRRYNLLGAMLHAPFSVERRLCEVPLVPGALRDFCLQGVGAVQLGLGRNDVFFCSQFVLEAFRRAGLPLTDADPRLVSPRDLLHMREGDVSSMRIHQPLLYVGHLKFQAVTAAN